MIADLVRSLLAEWEFMVVAINSRQRSGVVHESGLLAGHVRLGQKFYKLIFAWWKIHSLKAWHLVQNYCPCSSTIPVHNVLSCIPVHLHTRDQCFIHNSRACMLCLLYFCWKNLTWNKFLYFRPILRIQRLVLSRVGQIGPERLRSQVRQFRTGQFVAGLPSVWGFPCWIPIGGPLVMGRIWGL